MLLVCTAISLPASQFSVAALIPPSQGGEEVA